MYSNTLYQLFYYSGGEDGTPLACAASKGHVNVINYLLGQNVDVNGGIKVCDFKNDSNEHQLIMYITTDNTTYQKYAILLRN